MGSRNCLNGDSWTKKGARSLSMGHPDHPCQSGCLSPLQLSPRFSEEQKIPWNQQRICIEPLDSEKCALGVKCYVSLYLLQNQENEPLIPKVIWSEFSQPFPALPDTVNFWVWIDALLSTLTLQRSCTGNLLALTPFLGTCEFVGWKVYLMVARLRRLWLKSSHMLRYHLSV